MDSLEGSWPRWEIFHSHHPWGVEELGSSQAGYCTQDSPVTKDSLTLKVNSVKVENPVLKERKEEKNKTKTKTQRE